VETTSIRLPPGLIHAIERAAARRGVSRSTLVREAIEEYLRGAESAGLVALVDRLVTYPASGLGDLSTRGEEILRERFRGRRRRAR
jgi:Arc/MetJ-type ribon-helix-helix transcriptional regulator